MTKQQFEFGKAGLRAQWSVIAVKTCLVMVLLFSTFNSVAAESIEHRMQHVSLVLTAAFLYANVAQFKYELKQMFQPPITPIGYPLAILATMLYFGSFFLPD